MAAMTSLQYGIPFLNFQQKSHHFTSKLFHCTTNPNSITKRKNSGSRNGVQRRGESVIRCSGINIGDYIGGDLLKLDLGKWLADVEEHKAIAIYTPHEGGYEGRYLNRLRYQGYHFLEITARGLGDPEATLTKVHPVCPAHVGKQPIARWWFPPEVDYRLEALPPDAKGLAVWVIEAKVLSKAELQFLALLPSLRPNVRVIAECGNWRKFMWKPLKEIAGLAPLQEA
ncbi:NAD(P)H-quinone oxidoreductase subunit N chloroplastic [Bienertia sinuspersici]